MSTITCHTCQPAQKMPISELVSHLAAEHPETGAPWSVARAPVTDETGTGVRVTATDLDAGTSDSMDIWDDYVLTTAGTAYVAHVQAYRNGTHVITVKGVKRR